MPSRTVTFALTIAVVLLANPKASPQSPVPGVVSTDAPAPRLTTGSDDAIIRGRVLAAGSLRPLDDADVSIRAERSGATPIGARSNERGEFEARVPPGRYDVSATRYGFAATRYGVSSLYEMGRSVDIRSGELVERIDVILQPAARISGHVTDSSGAPIQGVAIQTVSARYVLGHKLELPSGPDALTDASGRYELRELAPGPYRLMASLRKTWPSDNPPGDTLSYGRTFFPDSDLPGAEVVVLNPGDVRDGVNFRLSARRVATVSGRVEASDGSPFFGGRVILQLDYPDLPPGVSARNGVFATAYTGPDGEFEFADVPPDNYLIVAGATGRGERASLALTVAERDASGLVLTVLEGSTLTGRVVTESAAAPPAFSEALRVTVGTGPGRQMLGTFAAIGMDWTFSLQNLAGRYLFRVSGLPSEWMLKTVRFNGADITDTPLEIFAGVGHMGDIEMVITRRLATVTGNIVDRDGRAIPERTFVLFPDDPALWYHESRFIRSGRTDDRGRFEMKGLPGGRYRVRAVDSVLYDQWWDPDYLASLRTDATRFSLDEGGSTNVTLRLP